MNETEFIAYLKGVKVAERSIQGYVESVKTYATYLLDTKHIADIRKASPQDLADFIEWGRRELDNVYRNLWGIGKYYEFIKNKEMANSACEWMQILQNETRRLGEFLSVDMTTVRKLKSIGITTAGQLLRAGKTEADWSALAEKCGASLESVIELVKLSNLARLPGSAKVRNRLYYEAGLDTLPKIAAQKPEEMIKLLTEYIEKSGFDGIPPVYSEAEFTIRMAKFLTLKDNG